MTDQTTLSKTITTLSKQKMSRKDIARKLNITEWQVRKVLMNKLESKTDKQKNPSTFVSRKVKRLFYDIETSYNIVKSWKIGYNIILNPEHIIQERAIICMCYKWEGENTVHSIHWDDGNDARIIQKFIELAIEADELIGHNADQYDAKFLMTRAIKHGIQGLPKYNSYDTLEKAKKYFMFNSNKLDYIAQYLELGKKAEHEGLSMWDKVILEKDEKALNCMINYCKQDVLLAEKVFNKLRLYTETNNNNAVLATGKKYACNNCGSMSVKLQKTYATKTGMIKRIVKCGDCRQQYLLSDKEYKNIIPNNKD